MQKFFQKEVWEKLRQLKGADARLRIAQDEEGIVAAYTHNRYDSDHSEYTPPEGYGNRLIGYLAIAARCRYQGGILADQALTDALYEALDAESHAANGVVVWGKVHRKNKASKSMLARNEFSYRVAIPDDGPLEHWALMISR